MLKRGDHRFLPRALDRSGFRGVPDPGRLDPTSISLQAERGVPATRNMEVRDDDDIRRDGFGPGRE